MPAPFTQDVIKSFDPTGLPQVTGAQLQQLVDGINVYVDKGLNINTADSSGVPAVPNANITTKWQRYLWIRDTGATIIVYQWNSHITPDVTLLNWQPLITANIPAGSIGNAQLQLNCVQDANIVGMAYGKLIGAPASFPPNGAAGGILGGSYPNPSWVGATGIIPISNIIVPNSPSYNCRVNSGGTAPEFAAFGTVQKQYTTIAGVSSTSLTVTSSTNIQVADGAQIAQINFTPKNTASYLKISLKGMLRVDKAVPNRYALFGLFMAAPNGSPTNPLTYAQCYYDTAITNNTWPSYYGCLEAIIASTNTSPRIIQARYGVTTNDTTAFFGLANNTGFLEIEEFFLG